ncbi:hypothetical protein ACIBG8_51920 [Nonomuraea sp. NPDC050556]|uniref:hypothetical protein n=1 Tax=Nonomuraea sp. NPDC050556 TaxID=3364369 RepID=UPI00378B73C9
MSTLAEQLIPDPDASERHAITIAASRERVWAALTETQASDIKLAKPLFAARDLVSRLRTGSPKQDRPKFTTLAEVQGREVVQGTIGQWWRLGRADNFPAGDDFAVFDRPGYARGTFSFELQDAGAGRVRLITETRVKATSPDARRAFLRYWVVIRLGSGLIRRLILLAIRRKSEGPRSR